MKYGVARKGEALVAAAATAAMLAFTAGATAAEPGIYLAVDIGSSRLDVKQSQLAGGPAGALDDAGLAVVALDAGIDKTSTRPALRWGYRFSPYLAAEVSVLSLGTARYEGTATVNDGVDDLDGALDSELKSRGPTFTAIGSWPLGERFSVDGQAGFYYFKTTQTFSYRFGSGLDSETDSGERSRREAGVVVGVGGTWSITRAAALRLSYTLFPGAAGKQDASRVAAGFQYSLGQ